MVFDPLSPNHWGRADYWAPEVVFHNGIYYMFYSARWRENNSLRIGVATSEKPSGPFAEAIGEPLFDFGWVAIDGHVFIDDCGTKYLYFSRDSSENIVSGIHESHIYVIKLADDMLSVIGEPTLLTRPEQSWEAPPGNWRWNEGAWVIKHEGLYYLMYSANYFASSIFNLINKNLLTL